MKKYIYELFLTKAEKDVDLLMEELAAIKRLTKSEELKDLCTDAREACLDLLIDRFSHKPS